MIIYFKEQKSKYFKDFDSRKNGPLHEQEWCKQGLVQYHHNIYELKQFHCSNCSEMWPSKINYYQQCKSNSVKFSWLNEIPTQKNLKTMIEEMLTSPILAVMSVFKLPNGALIKRGIAEKLRQNPNENNIIMEDLKKN